MHAVVVGVLDSQKGPLMPAKVIEGNIYQRWDETDSILTLPKRTHAPTDSKSPRELSSQHMDTKNESRGGRNERLEETHTLQVDDPMSDSCHSEPDLGHERQVTPSSSIERPRGDAGQGERVVSGIWCEGKWRQHVGARVEIFSF
jgi:hypothetical protein